MYADQGSYEPLARIDGITDPEMYWFHCQPNGTPERLTDESGTLRWEGETGAWGKLVRENRYARQALRRTCGCRGSIWTVTNPSGTDLNSA